MKLPLLNAVYNLGVAKREKTRAPGSANPASRSKASRHSHADPHKQYRPSMLSNTELFNEYVFSPNLKISPNQRGPAALPLPPRFSNPPEICDLDKPSDVPSCKIYQNIEPEGLEDQFVQPEQKEASYAVPVLTLTRPASTPASSG